MLEGTVLLVPGVIVWKLYHPWGSEKLVKNCFAI